MKVAEMIKLLETFDDCAELYLEDVVGRMQSPTESDVEDAFAGTGVVIKFKGQFL